MGIFGFPSAGFGPRKIAVALFGLLVLIAGIILFFWKKIRSGLIDVSNYSWTTLFGFSYLSVYLYVLFEWIFTITKPSFLDLVSISTKLGIFLFTSAMVTCLTFIALGLFFALGRLPWFRKSPKPLLVLASFIPVWIITSMLLILVDNFTFTLFNFGVVNTGTVGRIIYLVAYTSLFIFILFKLPRVLSDINSVIEKWKYRKYFVPVLLALVIGTLLVTYRNNNQNSKLQITQRSEMTTYPNIVIITADGLNADHMSLYGYSRNTTPEIDKLADSSLIATNAFPNSPKTYSGLLAIFTSKDPVATRVLTPPDILRGEDSYEHLPGILKTLGYYTAQFSYPVFADAYQANMLFGFDYANGRTISEVGVYDFLNKNFSSDFSYLLHEIAIRLLDRLEHIFFVKKMVNHQALVSGTKQKFDDEEKISKAEEVFSKVNQPVFIHLHWLGTHGPTYVLKTQLFSTGKNVDQQKNWDEDFYDDSILEFDAGVSALIEFLKGNNYFDNTILIISSDHGEGFTSTKQIPLLIHFPLGKNPGIRRSNVQQKDIAPTILEYMGVEKPSWMEGDSFLSGEIPDRPIFSASPGNFVGEGTTFTPDMIKPPFYELGSVTAVFCNSWFSINLEDKVSSRGVIDDYAYPCEVSPSNNQFKNWIVGHLKENGFDTSTINP